MPLRRGGREWGTGYIEGVLGSSGVCSVFWQELGGYWERDTASETPGRRETPGRHAGVIKGPGSKAVRRQAGHGGTGGGGVNAERQRIGIGGQSRRRRGGGRDGSTIREREERKCHDAAGGYWGQGQGLGADGMRLAGRVRGRAGMCFGGWQDGGNS